MGDTYEFDGYVISRATVRDVHPIRRLEQVVFPIDAYSYLSLSTLLLWPGAANFKAVDSEGVVVGFVAGNPDWGSEIDWIVTLGVHPGHRGHGLGRRLLAICEEHLSHPVLRLTVRVSNQIAIALYESAGYRAIFQEPRYYKDGENGTVMEKRRPAP